MLELLFLLLPVAAGYGWIMGRNSIKQTHAEASKSFSKQYFKGLNYLLADKADKAVDMFISVLDVDSDTADTHIALGNLFRRRGELDRAIRVHQNLVTRDTLADSHRLHAKSELAYDFLRAGMYDRAEAILLELTHIKEYKEKSLSSLISIYQATKEWQKAIDVADRLSTNWSETQMQLAHFYCELAELLIQQEKYSEAIKKLKKALSQHKQCVRANLMLGRLALKKHDLKQAIFFFEQVLYQDVDLVSEALPELAQCFAEKCHDDDGAIDELEDYLRQCVEKQAGVTATIMLANIIADKEGVQKAEQFVLTQLQIQPTMKGFHQLMAFHLKDAEQGNARESLAFLRKLVSEQINIRPIYRCSHCGFSGKTLDWQCPSCKHWGTTKPIRGLDGE